jgi:hypothetical protein
VLLFGSRAKGRFTPESDIDIYFEGVPKDRALEAIGACISLFGEESIDYRPDCFCAPPPFQLTRTCRRQALVTPEKKQEAVNLTEDIHEDLKRIVSLPRGQRKSHLEGAYFSRSFQ